MYKAKNGFIDSALGSLQKGQKVTDSPRAEDLFRLGYLEKLEYKTKVVERTPKKRKTKK